ncbi:MAG: DUF3298 domain-containing protein [Halomonas sp.]|nr:DUF3298 domain-containing protein [Halomonas sp.]MCC5900685.1 DUF3298 domain-containing protein [Halomonas sp.]
MLRLASGVCAVTALLLSGCQAPADEPVESRSLTTQALEKHYVEPGCQAENCSEVKVSALTFPQSPELSEQLQARLLKLAMGITEEGALPARNWGDYARNFFALTQEDKGLLPDFMASEAVLKADVYAQHNDLLVIELNGYVYQAGQAHGLPMTEFMVIDEKLQRVVDANDMLLEGQQAAFQVVLSQVHQRWVAEMGHSGQLAVSWPLSESLNIAPLETVWEVKYNVYELAPYVVGQPILTLPVEELDGIAKPRYIGR